jgi:hypothetical protein
MRVSLIVGITPVLPRSDDRTTPELQQLTTLSTDLAVF